MFEITLNDPKIVKGIFEAINAVVTETIINFDQNGISLSAIDEGRICLVLINLDKDDFDGYVCDKEHKLGLNIEDMVKILRRSSNDIITLKYKDDSGKINIIMKNNTSKKSRTFSLKLIDINESGIKPEALMNIPYKASVSIPLVYLDESIKDADIFSETLSVILSKNEGIIFKAEGQNGEMKTELEKDDDGVEEFNIEEDGEGSFAIAYLKNILKIGSITDRLTISLNPNTPIKCQFNILSNSSFIYFLAPRVEEEEEEDYDED
ncbi:MAG: proliferating cell nuclear antigen (pcna) [Promethearchaeota archaeon]